MTCPCYQSRLQLRAVPACGVRDASSSDEVDSAELKVELQGRPHCDVSHNAA
jgi:hypothetical protein